MRISTYKETRHAANFTDEKMRVGYLLSSFDKQGRIWTRELFECPEAAYGNLRQEIDAFIETVVQKEWMKSEQKLKGFCLEHPEARFGEGENETYCFFAQSDRCFFRMTICMETGSISVLIYQNIEN